MTKKFLKMAEEYKKYCPGYKERRFILDTSHPGYPGATYEYTDPCIDMSKEALKEMFEWESFGKGNLKRGIFNKGGKYNGYAIGKQFMDYVLTDMNQNRHLFPKFETEFTKDKGELWKN